MIGQLRLLLQKILEIYMNNRTVLGRAIWITAMIALYGRRKGSSSTEESGRRRKGRRDAGGSKMKAEVSRQLAQIWLTWFECIVYMRYM